MNFGISSSWQEIEAFSFANNSLKMGRISVLDETSSSADDAGEGLGH